jgi:maleate isomerase/arylmalonate decarboxylase
VSRALHYRPYGWRAKLGLIVPPTNTVNEAEWARMVPEGVTVHVTRMPLHADTSSDAGRAALYADIRKAVADLAPAGVDVIAYGCTAGSMVTPLTTLTDYMSSLCDLPCVATAPAIVQACAALGASRVALATPYHDALNEHERRFLAANGIATLSLKGLGIGAAGAHDYVRIARVPREEIFEHCVAAAHADAQALVVSCTDFAVLEAIPRLEDRLGVPVVTSNQATFWRALRTAGVDERFERFGVLLRDH